MLAQLADPTNEQVVELLKETLSGTPDAARAEPFTWIIALLMASFVLLGCLFGRKLIQDFMDFIDKQHESQREMQAECHKQSRDALTTVAASAAKCEVALVTHARSMEGHAEVMERVIKTLGGHGDPRS